MRRASRYRLSPSLLVSTVALVAALGGSAIALPGKNSVDKSDLAKNVVASKHLKPEAVKGSDIHEDVLKSKHFVDGAVGTAQIDEGAVDSARIGDGEVTGEDLAAPEPFQNVTDFGNGGQNDCRWLDGAIATPGVNPASFYKDPMGIVHLAGTVVGQDGPGGDGLCDDGQDQAAFTLPPGYRPDNLEAQLAVGSEYVAIAPEEDVTTGGLSIPAGTVVVPFVFLGTLPYATLDGITFRAAPDPPTTTAAKSGSTARLPSLDTLFGGS